MTSASDQLPAELLTLIVNEITSQQSKGLDALGATRYSEALIDDTVISCLKNLRLASRSFAYLECVLKVVFKNVHLRGDPDGSSSTQITIIPAFAKYVERVSFVPPKHKLGMTSELFEKLLNAQAPTVVVPTGETYSGRGMFMTHVNGWRESLRRESKTNLSPQELMDGFQRYDTAAKGAFDLLQSQKLRDDWVCILRAFSGCRSFRFPPMEHEALHLWDAANEEPEHDRDTEFEEEEDVNSDEGGYDDDDECLRLSASTSELLFVTAIEILARATIAVEVLDIKCALTGDFGWTRLPKWDQLDLAQLHTLIFRPAVRGYVLSSAPDEGTGLRAADALNALLGRCSDSLTSLVHENARRVEPYDDDWEWSRCPLNWPPSTAVATPKLRRLALGQMRIDVQNLCDWLGEMHMLEFFQLRNTTIEGEDCRLVFGVIRKHMQRNKPRQMKVDFFLEPVMKNPYFLEYDLTEYVTTNASCDTIVHPCRPHNVDDLLVQYLAGLSDWDAALDEVFW